MPGGKERALRRQIRSVQSTKKITKAMELIAASRILKAQQRVAAARPYSERITEVIRNLAAAGAGGDSPLLAERDDQRTEGRQTRLITVGKKASAYFRFRGWQIDESFEGFADQPAYENARQIAEFAVGRFEAGEYDRVELAYTQFLSVASQKVVIRRFVPLDQS